MPYLSGFTKRIPITIDKTNVDSDLTDFPILIAFNSNTTIGADIDSNGFNIKFTEDDGVTPLKHEIEYFAESGGSADGRFWVKIPTISSSVDTVIYLYFRSETPINTSDPHYVWDANYKAVYHFQNTTGNAVDSTLYGETLVETNTCGSRTGKIYNGRDFIRANQEYFLGTSSNILSGLPATLECWASPDVQQQVNILWVGSTSTVNGIYIGIDNATGYPFASSAQNDTTYASATKNTIANFSGWNYIAGTFASNSSRVCFLNGVPGTADTTTVAPAGYADAAIGALIVYGSITSNAFDGIIDEVRISDIVRSDEWIKFTYYNINESDNELSFGSLEQLEWSPYTYLSVNGTPTSWWDFATEQAVSISISICVEHILNISSNHNVYLEHLLSLSKTDNVTLEHLLGLSNNQSIILEHLLGLSSNKALLLEYLLNLNSEKTIVLEHILSMGNIDRGLVIEHLLGLSNDKNIALEHLLGLSVDKNAVIEYLLNILSSKSVNVEHLLGISDSLTAAIEHNLGIGATKDINLEHLLALSADLNIPIEHTLQAAFSAEKVICLEHTLAVGAPNTVSIEHILALSVTNRPALEHLLQIGAFKNVNIEHLTHISSAKPIMVEWISNIVAGGVLYVEWSRALAADKQVVLEFLRQTGASHNVNIEHLLKISKNATICLEFLGEDASIEFLRWILCENKTEWLLCAKPTTWVLCERPTTWTLN